ncbi:MULTISPECIES: hypothetical protein [unclassified Micromonospora]|uniref:hypothetical protein n=1 Tax=unclassified Micromonospora TaxID=2617518 RepID=UPI0018901AFB|nr:MULTISPECIES: hypothetical protein [unclassified Micromonospora]MBF5031593.1 hypothetical protein [Micromonospora sp. ANENR4]MCZ7477681.1 hypothetical protein [Micromonospora sp. WMMC273]WBC02406.1 hypothetical protein O7546_25310 [Micromonospora sp. WMMA1976]
MIALVRLRLAGFLRTGRALAPVLAGLLVLGVLYGGGRARPAEAYGVSAVVLFPVLAWQTKILLDVEPDVQRRMARVVAGPARERAAGLLAALVAGLAVVLLALALPWPLGGVTAAVGPGDRPVLAGVALGFWAHLLALPAAVALGALASRAVTRSAGYGVAVLVTGAVGVVVLGLSGSVVPWLAPPVMATARALTGPVAAGEGLLLTGWAALWAAVALTGYAWARRTRA